MRTLGMTLMCLLVASLAQAQTQAVGTETLVWDQAGTTAAAVQAFTYDVQDGSAAPVALTGVTCSGASSPFVCQTRLPALTTGLHAVSVRARTVINGTPLVGSFSAPLSLLIVAVPAVPQNVRLL